MTLSNYISGINNNCRNKLCSNDCDDYDFIIKKQDTKPSFRICIKECGEIVDYSDENLILEANIWFNAKLKNSIDTEIDYFQLINTENFEQLMIGDVIVVEKGRMPEYMLVIGFDESNKLVRVERGYHNTKMASLKKGTNLKIFRNVNATANIQSVYEDIILEDGDIQKNVLTATYFNYDFDIKDTCLAGCYFIEFKLIKMKEQLALNLSIDEDTISFTPENLSLIDFGCYLDESIEWVRRYPSDKIAYKIKVLETPTVEI